MSSSLYRLGRAMAAAGWKIVALWTALLIAVAALAFGLNGSFSTEFEIPGTEGQAGIDNLATRFPEMGGTSGQVVFRTTDGTTVDELQGPIEETMTAIGEVEGVEVAPSPFDELSPGTRNQDDTALIAQFQMDGQIGEFPASAPSEVLEIIESANTAQLEAHLGGQVLSSAEIPFSIGEVLGIVAALIILAIIFRSFLPAIIPIVTAVVGVGISMLALVALSAGVDIPSVTTTLGAMLGLAVGIDYALFILHRHRGNLERGDDVSESIGTSLATSGSAVIFAGIAVIIALVGLFVTRIPFVTIMGIAAAATVALSVLVAVTMLPAIMGILGERLRPRKVRRLMADNGGTLPQEDPSTGTRRKPFGTTWVRLVTKVPALTILLVVIGVGALAVPLKDLELALPDQGTDQPGTPARETYDLIAEEFGPGYNGPLLVTADIINTTDPLGVVEALETEIASHPDVREIQIATPNRGADLAVIAVVPEGGPTEQSTKDLVQDLREAGPSWEEEFSISEVTVTGATAVGIDVTDMLSKALLPFAIFVVGLSLILLMVVFRSVWVPIKASLGYLLSVGAAFGVTAMVFEYGWFNGPLFVSVNGPVVAFMPIFVMGVLFGLAMDYEVFLVSRMREEFVRTGDAKGAIERGFTGSAPVVTAAALIMVVVFTGFITSGWFMLQPIAVGLAVGVLVDAFVVRMTLVPAVLALLGPRAWSLPGWLDRLLPTVDVEGEGLEHVLEHRDWTEHNGRASLRLDGAVVPTPDGGEPLGPLSGSIAPGTLLVVRSTDDAARAALLSLIGGRIKPTEGVVALNDRLLPQDTGVIQARTHWIPTGADVSSRLEDVTGRDLARRMVVVEQIEDLAHAATVSGDRTVAQLDALLERGVTVVVGSRSEQALDAERHLRASLQDPTRLTALALHRSPAPEGALV
ncbi:MMPL family transporter [Brachybacterium sp. Marseille-Q2903]|uniref:MMPL family transporter n=1 Tax=Brachybacterium epidermidis TaxID=2781983 RepID=A0ABR9W2D2_9MICO|nr:MMPL family transporter [Brachybacterium epidermidis]